MYSKSLIEKYNETLEDDDFTKAQKIIEKVTTWTEKLSKHFSNNLSILQHLLYLYQQSDNTEKAESIKRKISRIDGGMDLLKH